MEIAQGAQSQQDGSHMSAARLKQARAFCELFAKVNARHFYYAFRLMPAEERHALYAIYAFCQKADQLMDLEPDPAEKRARLLDRRKDLELLADCLQTGRDPGDDLILVSLHETLQKRPVPLDLFHALLDGLEMDLNQEQYNRMEELDRYCWHVAGAVGRMVVAVLGGDPERLNPYADTLGLAMQLTNIARDVREDQLEGRVYLPCDLLDRHGEAARELDERQLGPGLKAAMIELCQRADGLYNQADAMLVGTDRRLMRVARVMAALYRPILGELKARDYNVFLGKVGYPIWKKLLIALRTMVA
jgi:phytoene synthase